MMALCCFERTRLAGGGFDEPASTPNVSATSDNRSAAAARIDAGSESSPAPKAVRADSAEKPLARAVSAGFAEPPCRVFARRSHRLVSTPAYWEPQRPEDAHRRHAARPCRPAETRRSCAVGLCAAIGTFSAAVPLDSQLASSPGSCEGSRKLLRAVRRETGPLNFFGGRAHRALIGDELDAQARIVNRRSCSHFGLVSNWKAPDNDARAPYGFQLACPVSLRRRVFARRRVLRT